MKYIPYFGSKSRELDTILKYANNIDTVVDVFGGSGCVGININSKNTNSKNIIYNDTNPRLIQLVSILKNPSKKLISDTNKWNDTITQKTRFQSQQECKDYFEYHLNQVTNKKLVFLIKCFYSNFNGYYTYQKKDFQLGTRKRGKGDEIEYALSIQRIELEKYHNTYKNIDTITCEDYKVVLHKYNKKGYLLYLDPPYINDNSLKNLKDYTNHFDTNDMDYIFDFTKTCKCKIILNVPYNSDYSGIKEIYEGQYMARGRNKFTHCIIGN